MSTRSAPASRNPYGTSHVDGNRDVGPVAGNSQAQLDLHESGRAKATGTDYSKFDCIDDSDEESPYVPDFAGCLASLLSGTDPVATCRREMALAIRSTACSVEVEIPGMPF